MCLHLHIKHASPPDHWKFWLEKTYGVEEVLTGVKMSGAEEVPVSGAGEYDEIKARKDGCFFRNMYFIPLYL